VFIAAHFQVRALLTVRRLVASNLSLERPAVLAALLRAIENS